MAARARLIGLAALSLSAASATAQSLMLTKGQVVAELNDAPAGLTLGEYFSTTTPFDFPAMSSEGNILIR